MRHIAGMHDHRGCRLYPVDRRNRRAQIGGRIEPLVREAAGLLDMCIGDLYDDHCGALPLCPCRSSSGAQWWMNLLIAVAYRTAYLASNPIIGLSGG